FSNKDEPVAQVTPPISITFQTLDCSTDRVKSESDMAPIPITEVNPVTGPIYINGANPGDALAVKIQDIRLGSQAHIRLIPGSGICRDRVKAQRIKICRIINGIVEFSPHIRIPVRPMVGTIGTAPLGAPIHTVYGGPPGGNLDNSLVAPGATIYLPVFVPGALLALGDVHACMGDGELCGLALETNGEVDVEVHLLRGVALPAPFGENDEVIFGCGFYPTPWEAIEGVSTLFADFLVKRFGLSLEEAVLLISAVADLRVCQCQPGGENIGVSVRIELPKRILGMRAEGRLF
ncbi:MAG: hypothetical protein GX493_03030, partial [Firmicutes bacterium]|nr:hypothetical protein [Bacillota bacterium]